MGNKQVFTDSEFIIMVVGGPNARRDFHVDPGEEFFYQLEGGITLATVQDGKRVDVPIGEGEIFLLPPDMPHSPRRPANTVGLVIERTRRPGELDGFQWYCENCGTKLYEEFIEVTNIETQLPPVFDRFFGSIAHRTCSQCGTVMEQTKVTVIAELTFGGQKIRAALDRGVSLAIAVDFSGAGPRHFGAGAPSVKPFAVGNFSGSVATGASANCSSITLIPHCQMTHTESVAHLTRESGDAWRVVPRGLLPAVVVSVSPEPARESNESTDPQPWGTDMLITRRRLRAAWPMGKMIDPVAAVIRTLPNDAAKRTRDYSDLVPPYLTREAVEWLVEKRIEHLVLDVPSLDRTHDEGHLVGHRLFFGLPAGSTARGDASRSRATITELAFIPDEVADGPCILTLAVPAIGGDAVPSQPIVYPLAP